MSQKQLRAATARDGRRRSARAFPPVGGTPVPGQPPHRPGLGRPCNRPTPRPNRLVGSPPRRTAIRCCDCHRDRGLGRAVTPTTPGPKSAGRIRCPGHPPRTPTPPRDSVALGSDNRSHPPAARASRWPKAGASPTSACGLVSPAAGFPQGRVGKFRLRRGPGDPRGN
jgi:hypothetical protein